MLGPVRSAVMRGSATQLARQATLGCQDKTLAEADIWLLPNRSGAQAVYQLNDLVHAFRAPGRTAARIE